MSFPPFVRLLPGILAPLLICSAARAQIHEEKPGPGLEEGVIFHHAENMPYSAMMISRHELPGSQGADVGTQDFTVCFWVSIEDQKLGSDLPIGGLSKSSRDTGWSLRTGDGVIVDLRNPSSKDPITLKAPYNGKSEGAHHIAIVIKREARQPLSGIWIDGVERVSIAVPPINLSCPDSPLTFFDYHGRAQYKDTRIYNRALTRPEILELMLQGTASLQPKPKHPTPPANGPRFIPQQDETIALIGGTEAAALAESGELEALLLMAFPNTRFHFRSLAWEGDTVFKQDRPMNFGSLEQQLRRVNAGAVFVMFGRQECLDAEGRGQKAEGINNGGLAEFKAAFDKLLATVEKVTPNIVVIGPPPFEKKPPPLPDLSERNEELKAYSKTMEEETGRHEAVFGKMIDAQNTYFFIDMDPRGWTTNGVTLNHAGRLATSYVLAGDLKCIDPNNPPEGWTTFTKPLNFKNRLWHDYWRPSNWAFLHGDRTNQPSSRDPVNPQIRFFPSEQEKYLPLIKDAEEKIFKLVEEAQKKLP